MIKSPDRWVLCPICGNKTRTKIRPDTILENFPLFCPKCKQETLISAKDLNVAVIPQQIAESAGAVNGQDELACALNCSSDHLHGLIFKFFRILLLDQIH